MKFLRLTAAALLLCGIAFALDSAVPAQSGNTILVPITPSDDAGSTVLLVTSLDPAAVRFFVSYTHNGVAVTRALQRSGAAPDKYGVIVLHVPIMSIQDLVIENAATGHQDHF
jgi:hypothetical protein